MILESRPDIEAVADSVDGKAALAAVAAHRPDVLLLDIRKPKLDGLEVTRRLARRDGPRIVIVTTFDLDEYVHAALHGGASGFLLKDASPAMLVEAVRAAAVADSLVSPAITVRLLRDTAPRATAAPPARRAPHGTRTGRRRRPPRPPPGHARGGYGLAGMAERAEALGGSVTAGPAPEGGWLVTAVLPL